MGSSLISFLFLSSLLPGETAVVAIGGIIVLAKIWEKIRPVIIAKSDERTEYFFGVSHSGKRKNMKPLTQDGINGFEVDEKSSYGLCNKPSEILAQIGTISPEKAKEMIDSLPEKKRLKIEKRSKSAE